MRWYVTTNYYDVRCNCGPFINGRGGVKGNLHFGLPLSIDDFKRDSIITRDQLQVKYEVRCVPVLVFVMHCEGQLLNCPSIGARAVR